MCGVIGVSIPKYSNDLGKLVRNIFIESEIRGMHATGLTYYQNGKLTTLKSNVKASKFVEALEFETMTDNGGLFLIGHCRYSTSDLEYNQPMESVDMCLVHNGVITQEPKENWPFEVEGGNDSMLLLSTLISGKRPEIEWPDASIAFCSLNALGTLTTFRNGKRPLYVSYDEEQSIFVTSTADIAKRAGLNNPVEMESLKTLHQHRDGFTVVINHELANHQDLQRIRK